MNAQGPLFALQVALAIVAVVVASVVLTASIDIACRTRHWLWLICAAGAGVFLVGMVGQRVFPTEAASARLGVDAALTRPGAWEAGVTMPLISVHLTPISVVGLLLGTAGASLVLFFKRVPDPDSPVSAGEP